MATTLVFCPECGAGIGLVEHFRNIRAGGLCDECARRRARFEEWRAMERRWGTLPPTLPPLPRRDDDPGSGSGGTDGGGAPATP